MPHSTSQPDYQDRHRQKRPSSSGRREEHESRFHQQPQRVLLLRRQHELADEMDDLLAWEEAITTRCKQLELAGEQHNIMRGKAVASVLLHGGPTTFSSQWHYERARLAQEYNYAQKEWQCCKTQQAAVQRKLQRVLFELSLI